MGDEDEVDFRPSTTLSKAGEWLVALALVGMFVWTGLRTWRDTRPQFPLPPDDAGCPPAMARIPGGFVHAGGETPDIFVDTFCLDRNEVTSASYLACIDRHECRDPARAEAADLEDSADCNLRAPGRRLHPMNCLSFKNAENFCERVGKRLPMTSEWHYAAEHGGDRYTYLSGMTPPAEDEGCWRKGEEHRLKTCAVRSFHPSPFGLFDMDGNVDEMVRCADCALPVPFVAGGAYGDSPRVDPRGVRADSESRFTERASPETGFRCAGSVSRWRPEL